jgi:Fur family ferric uptake transcriptional regulator
MIQYLAPQQPVTRKHRATRDYVDSKHLKEAGLKITYPRKRILDILERHRTRHLTADDIYRCLVEADEEIGLATVYRVLNQFESAGLVEKHNFEGGQAYYELDSGQHHDHMVCLETGKVIEFMSEEIEAAQQKIARKHGYEIEDHRLVIYVRPKKK